MHYNFKHFVKAMNHAFKEMADLDLVNGDPKDYGGEDLAADISTNIGLTGEKAACIVLTMTEGAGKLLTARIRGEAAALRDDLISDIAGELLNILVGISQRNSKIKFEFSIPVSIIGKNHVVRPLKRGYTQGVISTLQDETIGLYFIELER